MKSCIEWVQSLIVETATLLFFGFVFEEMIHRDDCACKVYISKHARVSHQSPPPSPLYDGPELL